MKNLSTFCLLFMLFAVGTAHAQQYEVAPCGTKDFITAADVEPGGTICLDIWLTDANAPQFDGGAWVDFTGSTADIAYVSAGRALWDGSEGPTAPWDPAIGVFLNEPAGVGTIMYVVGALLVPPDGDGDIIVGTVTLQNLGPGAAPATINITTILGVATWTPADDATINANTTQPVVTIHEVCNCSIDEDCDDGLFCNGAETCDAPNCTCLPGTNPCPTDATCNEDTDICNPISATGIPTLSEGGIIIFMTIILGIGVVTLLRRRTMI